MFDNDDGGTQFLRQDTGCVIQSCVVGAAGYVDFAGCKEDDGRSRAGPVLSAIVVELFECAEGGVFVVDELGEC